MKLNIKSIVTAFVLVGSAVPSTSNALTMIASDINDICERAKWIVLAKVVKEELQYASDVARTPSMCYTLQKISRWDKHSDLAPMRLCYLGDLISTRHLIVAGLRYPVVNEIGIFFISSLEGDDTISPLVGWNQGHFEIKMSDAMVKSVYTSDSKAVCGFDSAARSDSLDGASADGLIVDSEKKHCSPIAITEFEEKVRQCSR